MESYLIDSAVLEQIVDSVINEKYPNKKVPAEFKKKAMLALDNQILRDILANLTRQQGQELNALLDKNDSDPEAFESFFKERGIDLEKIIENAMVKFKKDLEEGGKNA